MIDHTKPYFITPFLSLHPDELYMYSRQEWIEDKRGKKESSLNNLTNNYHHNRLSEKATKKAKRAIKYLVYNSCEKKAYNHKLKSTFTFKVNFITLTLSSPQIHSDQTIKSQLLNQFLIEAKKKWQLVNYVWKAERQRNGNIHFHILTDVWIPWSELRSVWNRIQEKLGYITEFENRTGKSNPNSTDVHSLKKVQNVSAYLVKYMTKNYKGNHEQVSSKIRSKLKGLGKDNISVSNGAKKYLQSIAGTGRIWTCSKELSNITGAQVEMTSELEEEINRLQKKAGIRRFDKDYVTGIYFNNDYLRTGEFPLLSHIFLNYIATLFRQKEQLILNFT